MYDSTQPSGGDTLVDVLGKLIEATEAQQGASFTYLQPGGIDTYLQPGGVDGYLQPA